MMKTNILRNAGRSIVLTAAALVTAGCASGPKIISNNDPAFDFFGVRTYAYMEPLFTDRGTTRSLLSSQLIAATDAELSRRGMTLTDDNPDVLVNFLFETQEQLRTRQSSASVSMHRGGRYGMWGGTMSTPTIEQVTQGMLSIDMVDPVKNQLVWEGSATDRVTSRIRSNQEQAVNFFVEEIFRAFPR